MTDIRFNYEELQKYYEETGFNPPFNHFAIGHCVNELRRLVIFADYREQHLGRRGSLPENVAQGRTEALADLQQLVQFPDVLAEYERALREDMGAEALDNWQTFRQRHSI
jgi:hypothetical protein